ncbi:hypothetical protein B0H19DRAFT_964773 [Mycena capillaripes]|nr:hypothetical protein B0H19DRAFT_964773 [Mycena capillaripes]
MKTLKAIALQHLTREGSMLGIGRADEPEPMYRNVEAYPGMFPWLFPYGKGGIGHLSHRHVMSDISRKKNLLLYHDKRFQTDMYFPMIAFNHEHLRGASAGSKAFVKRSNFEDVSRRLRRINPEVAGNIADRLAEGEHPFPATPFTKVSICMNGFNVTKRKISQGQK